MYSLIGKAPVYHYTFYNFNSVIVSSNCTRMQHVWLRYHPNYNTLGLLASNCVGLTIFLHMHTCDFASDLQNDCKQVHTSGRRSDSGWVWGSTGQAFTYTNWAPSEPNNWQGLNEDVCGLKIYLEPTVIAWNDMISTYKCCSICEFVQPL